MQAFSDWLFDSKAHGGMTHRAWIALAFIALLAMAPGLTSLPVMDRDEARYSQAASQMMETGDYVDIRFQDAPRHVKPAGIYWMQVIAAAPFGGAEAGIWAFRLPSLIGGMIAVFGTAWLAARLFGPQAGLAAGLLMATALMMQVEARTAKTDAMLLAAGVLAQTGLMMTLLKAEAGERLKFIGWPLLFWAASGAAIMIKGPIIAMVSALTLAGYLIWRWKSPWPILAKFHWLKGLAVLSAIALPWLIVINIATEGAFLQESVGHALFGKVGEADDSHGGPFLYHTLLSAVTFWPGSALLGLAILAAWAGRKKPEIRFLILWALLTWIVFEFVQTKLPHYVLPAFPALAILAAVGLMQIPDLLTGWKAKTLHRLWIVLAVIAGLVIAALPLVGAIQLGEDQLVAVSIAAALGGVSVAALIWFVLKPGLARLLPLSALVAVQYMAAFGIAVPMVDAAWPSNRVARLVDTLAGCEAYPAATAGYREPSNVFYLGTDVALTDGAGAAASLLLHPDCGIAVVDVSERAAFDIALSGEAVRTLGRVEGMNLVKGDALDLAIVTLEASRVRAPG